MSLDFSRLTILVVDDNPHMRLLVRDVLYGFGVKNIIECGEGSEAMSELRHNPVDLALVDWMMEPLDGLDFTRLIRTASDSPNTYLPIIMLTGHTERHRVMEARDAGVTDFMAKPVTAKNLYAHLRNIIENPRPFIRTSIFTGPCRRRIIKPDYAGPLRRADDAESGGGLGQDDIDALLGDGPAAGMSGAHEPAVVSV